MATPCAHGSAALDGAVAAAAATRSSCLLRGAAKPLKGVHLLYDRSVNTRERDADRTGDARGQWAAWARRELGDAAAEQAVEAAVDAALAALRAGANPQEAAAAARTAAGRQRPDDTRLLNSARVEIAYALRALRRARPAGELTEGALAALRSQFEAGEAALALAETIAQTMTPPAVSAPPAVRVSFLEFLADHSIQLLAYSGAFLLAIAVLLFDLSGKSPARFWAVAGLNAVFTLGGWVALRRPALRVVALSYIALAALLLPLTGLAAYVFLGLGSLGVEASLAATIIAATCAAVYAALALSIGSRAYAGLSLGALALAVAAGIEAAHQRPWIGAGIAALAPAMAVLAERTRRSRHVYALPSEVSAYAAAVVGVLWAAQDTLSADHHWPRTTALLLVSAAAIIRAGLLERRLELAWLAATPLPAAALSLGHSLGFDLVRQRALMLMLATVAVLSAWTLAGRLTRGNRGYLRALAAVLGVLSTPFPPASTSLQIAFLLAATAVGLLLTLSARQAGWLWLPAATFTLAWYWIVKAAVPPPPAAGPADLARAYAPLAVLLLGCALIARWRGGRAWAWPLYGAAALVATGSVALAVSVESWQLAGLCLLVFAALTYAVAALERSGWAAGTAVLAAAAGVALLLLGANAGAWVQVLALSGAGLVSYALGIAAGRWPRLLFAHPFQRALGGALSTIAALAGVAALGSSASAVTAGSGSALAAALVLAVDRALYREPVTGYAAPIAASLVGVHLARLGHLSDITWHVVLPAVVVAWTGVRLGGHSRLRARIGLSRTITAAGALLLFSTTALQAWGSSPVDVDPKHTGWLAIEGAVGLVAAVYARSRALAISAGAALAAAALLSALLLARATSLSFTFGAVAVALILLATLLALFRGRLAGDVEVARGAWDQWV